MKTYISSPVLQSDHYTSLIMSPEAKAEMVLPDKKPLPNLVIQDTISSAGADTTC